MSLDLVSRIKIKDDASKTLASVGKRTAEVAKATESLTGSQTKAAAAAMKETRALRDMESTARRTATALSTVGRVGKSAIGGIGSAVRGSLGAVTSLKAALLASGAAYAAIYKPLQLASDAEQANIAFETMLGSAKRAQSLLADLTDFANMTPFELPELRDASKRLLAFGFDAKKIIPMMTGVGNAAAGLGLGGDGIDRLTLALGQMKAKAKVSGDEMLQLTEAGIPAWDILAKKMKISTAQVMKLSEKGLIPADAAINTLIDGMNQRFPQMMDKQSKTLQGMASTIKDTFSNKILKEWGDGIASGIEPRLSRLVTWIDKNEAKIKQWGETLKRVAKSATDWIADKFEKAMTYARTHFLENPEFQKLPDFESKVNFVIKDIGELLKEWYDTGGKAKIESFSSGVVDTVASALQASAPLLDAASKIGTSIAEGVISGFWNSIKSDPKLAAIMGGGAGAAVGSMFGPAGIVIGGGIGAAGSAGASLIHSNSPYVKAQESAKGVSNFIAQSEDFHAKYGKDTPLYPNTVMAPRNSHASGLDRVPYNGYAANLHRDEAVLTKTEASDWRAEQSGKKAAGSVNITINEMNVRKDSDIDDIAYRLASYVA